MLIKENLNILIKMLINDDEIFHLRNHNKILLAGMKKLKNERKMQQKNQTMDKDTNTDVIDI